VDEWQYVDISSQQWVFTDLGTGYDEIANVNSGLAMSGSSNSVVQETYTGSTSQQWALTRLTGGWYEIINRASGKSLDIVSANGSDGGGVDMYQYSGTPQQTFFLVTPANWGTGLVNLTPGGDIQAAIDQVGTMGGGTVNMAAGRSSFPSPARSWKVTTQ